MRNAPQVQVALTAAVLAAGLIAAPAATAQTTGSRLLDEKTSIEKKNWIDSDGTVHSSTRTKRSSTETFKSQSSTFTVTIQPPSPGGGTGWGNPQVSPDNWRPGFDPKAVAGQWMIGGRGQKCSLSLQSRKWMDGYGARTGTGCSNDIFMVNSWELRGSQLVLMRTGGAVVARFQPARANRWRGHGPGGASLEIWR